MTVLIFLLSHSCYVPKRGGWNNYFRTRICDQLICKHGAVMVVNQLIVFVSAVNYIYFMFTPIGAADCRVDTIHPELGANSHSFYVFISHRNVFLWYSFFQPIFSCFRFISHVMPKCYSAGIWMSTSTSVVLTQTATQETQLEYPACPYLSHIINANMNNCIFIV